MTNYKNPFCKPGHPIYGPEFYSTDAVPVSRGGCLIYNRIKGGRGKGGVWDVVLNGVCIGQYAGPDCVPHSGPRAMMPDYRVWLVSIGACTAEQAAKISLPEA